jgi:hypothetical protein
MAEVMIWQPFELILWGIAISMTVICAIFYFKNAKNTSANFNEKLIIYGWTSVYIGIAFFIFFLILMGFQLPGKFIGNGFYGNYSLYEVKNNYLASIFCRAGFVSHACGWVLFYYSFERIFKRTRYLLTSFILVSIVLIILLPLELTYIYFTIVYSSVHLFTFFYIMFIYSKWSRLEFKAVSFYLMFGASLFIPGLFLTTFEIKQLNIVPLILGPIFIIIGTSIGMIPAIAKQNILSKVAIYWCSAFSIGCFIVVIVYFTIINVPIEYVVIHLGILLFMSYIMLYTRSIIKKQEKSYEKKELREVLTAFTKPSNVTEEEISISKEKKICLVCKGKLSRINYICPECDALYCINCSEALSNLENACWVCNEPFDESKPVKPFKKEEDIEEIQVETSEKPQKKPKTKK